MKKNNEGRAPSKIPAQDKIIRFIQEYPKDNNGAAAAIRAGYAPKTANVTASRLLAKANIRSAIKESQEKLAAEAKLGAQDYWRQLRWLLDFDPAALFDDNGQPKKLSDIPEKIRFCLKGYRIKRIAADGGEIIEVDCKFPDPLATVHELGQALRITDDTNQGITAIQVSTVFSK
jgi:hypothetical protein